MIINGWEILFYQIFYEQYKRLINHVKTLRKKNPVDYKSHPQTKLLASIQKVIKQDVPTDPFHRKFILGKTLGKKYQIWRRVKHGLPQRYRMFFRFHSKCKNIVFVWLNSEGYLRNKGDKHDVYVVFKKLLGNKKIPRDYGDLIVRSQDPKIINF